MRVVSELSQWLLTVDGELCPGLQFLMLAQSSVPDCAPVMNTMILLVATLRIYLYTAPSVFLCGMMVSTLRLSSSLVAPSTRLASSSWDWPSLYHLIWGGGDPPRLEQVRLRGLPSMATGEGGDTGARRAAAARSGRCSWCAASSPSRPPSPCS